MKLTPAQRQTLDELEVIVRRGDRPGPYGRGALRAMQHRLRQWPREDQAGDDERVAKLAGLPEVADHA